MTDEWPDIAATYDLVAADYADMFASELADKPLDRKLLDRFAHATAPGPVWDVGCGPAGQVTAYLAEHGIEVLGIDLSQRCVAQAAERHPALQFRQGDMRDLGDGSPAGIVAFYSLIHLPRAQAPQAVREFARVLAPGGVLLLAVHAGTGELDQREWFGKPAPVRATLFGDGELADVADAAGLTVTAQHVRDPYPAEHTGTRRAYLWAERPA